MSINEIPIYRVYLDNTTCYRDTSVSAIFFFHAVSFSLSLHSLPAPAPIQYTDFILSYIYTKYI